MSQTVTYISKWQTSRDVRHLPEWHYGKYISLKNIWKNTRIEDCKNVKILKRIYFLIYCPYYCVLHNIYNTSWPLVQGWCPVPVFLFFLLFWVLNVLLSPFLKIASYLCSVFCCKRVDVISESFSLYLFGQNLVHRDLFLYCQWKAVLPNRLSG